MMIVQLLAEDVDSCKNYIILTSPLSNLKQTVNFFSFFFLHYIQSSCDKCFSPILVVVLMRSHQNCRSRPIQI